MNNSTFHRLPTINVYGAKKPNPFWQVQIRKLRNLSKNVTSDISDKYRLGNNNNNNNFRQKQETNRSTIGSLNVIQFALPRDLFAFSDHYARKGNCGVNCTFLFYN